MSKLEQLQHLRRRFVAVKLPQEPVAKMSAQGFHAAADAMPRDAENGLLIRKPNWKCVAKPIVEAA